MTVLLLSSTGYGLFNILAILYEMLVSRLFPSLRDTSLMIYQTVGQLLYHAVTLPAGWIAGLWRTVAGTGDILGAVEKVLRGFEEMMVNDVANEL